MALVLIRNQKRRMEYIDSVLKEIEDGDVASMDVYDTQTRFDQVILTWEKIDSAHDTIMNYKDLPAKNNYIKEDWFASALKRFVKTKAALKRRLSVVIEESRPIDSQLSNLSINQSAHSRPSLPPISLPSFSGSYTEWRQFKDMFLSLVGEDTHYSNVEKMQYLSSCLTGSAKSLIKNTPVNSTAFQSAWDLLVERYENKRLLISAELDRLFSLPMMDSKSAQGLTTLLNTTNEAINALKSLGSPIEHWDQLLIHLITSRLDFQTRNDWEISLGSSPDYPQYSQLKLFLISRVRALESIAISVTSRKPKAVMLRPTKNSAPASKLSTAHVYTSSISKPLSSQVNSTQSQQCSCCKEDHFIVFCSKFRGFSDLEKYNWVTNQHLCVNCLGKHPVNVCRNKKRCTVCGENHHSMLHSVLPGKQSSSKVSKSTSPQPGNQHPSTSSQQ